MKLADNLTLNPELTALLEKLSEHTDENTTLASFFDARGLSCPMPLLKAKVALRGVPDGQGLYLLASDKNSQTDITAFCQKNGLSVQAWERDGAYHFVIVKPVVI